jgi:hypothetical protein
LFKQEGAEKQIKQMVCRDQLKPIFCRLHGSRHIQEHIQRGAGEGRRPASAIKLNSKAVTHGPRPLTETSICFLLPSFVHPAGTITVHLQRDSRGHLSLVAHPLKENREPFKVSPKSAAVTIWQTLQQTTGSGSSASPLAQLAHSLKER